ncbi:MAG: type II secretion system protein [Verrucomicrobia bacterium]|nr:type II secretion system protein [Verrucomicrobiota bacterium]
MKFGARPTNSINGKKSPAERAQAGFTLAEVLAALLFMAIVIPVAVQGLQIASLAGTVADRKGQAARVAERLLNESLVTTNWSKSVQNGTLVEGDRQFRWTLRNETWSQDGNLYAPKLLSVEVTYAVQSRDYFVRLSTLTPGTMPQ